MTIVFLAQDPAMLKAVKPHHGEFTVTKIEGALTAGSDHLLTAAATGSAPVNDMMIGEHVRLDPASPVGSGANDNRLANCPASSQKYYGMSDAV